MPTIGELIINLKASTASFVTELEAVKNLSFSTANEIQRSFSLIGSAALGMLGAFTGAMVASIDKTGEFEVHVLHLAAAAGTSVETMSGLAFAAQMYGLEIDKVASAMEKFDKQMVAAGAGNKKAEQNMALFGIDVNSIKTSDEALMKLADHFAGMTNMAQRTGEAMLAFSKNGAAMLPILELGSSGIQKLMDQAKALGVVFDKEDADAALRFHQTIVVLEGEFEGFRIQLEKALLPNLNALGDIIVENSLKATGHSAVIDVLTTSFKIVASAVVILIQTFDLLSSWTLGLMTTTRFMADAMVNAFKAVGEAGQFHFAEAGVALKKVQQDFIDASQAEATRAQAVTAIGVDANLKLAAIWGEGTRASNALTKAQQDAAAAAAGHAKELKKLTDQMASTIETLKVQVATHGLYGVALDDEKVRLQLVTLGHANLYDAWVKEKTILEQILAKADAMADFYKKSTATREQIENANFLSDTMKAQADDARALAAAIEPLMGGIPNASFTNIFGTGVKQNIQDFITGLEGAIRQLGMTKDAVERLRLATEGALPPQIEQILALEQAYDAAKEHAANLAAAWREFGQVAYRSLTDLIFSGKSFANVLADITKQLGEMFLKWALFGPTGQSGLFGSLFKGLGSFFGFAEGGQVAQGVPIVVGERGPEVFVPSSAGTIVPNGGGAGPSVNVTYYIDARGSSITEEQFRRSMAETENRAVKRALTSQRELTLRTA